MTDGGHWDNLGLVELLRNRLDWVWCFDASGDKPGTYTTFAQAASTADSQLGVTLELQPDSQIKYDPTTKTVHQPYAIGTIHYPATNDEPAKTGTLVLVTTGIWSDAPWSVRGYQNTHAAFPNDPTLDQFFNADRFDAYVQLGRAATERAWTETGHMR